MKLAHLYPQIKGTLLHGMRGFAMFLPAPPGVAHPPTPTPGGAGGLRGLWAHRGLVSALSRRDHDGVQPCLRAQQCASRGPIALQQPDNACRQRKAMQRIEQDSCRHGASGRRLHKHRAPDTQGGFNQQDLRPGHQVCRKKQRNRSHAAAKPR